MVVFMNSFSGKSKKNDKPFQRVTLLEVRKSEKTGTVMSKQCDFFVDCGLDCSNLVCGDVVAPGFAAGAFLGAEPELIEIKKLGKNVFVPNL